MRETRKMRSMVLFLSFVLALMGNRVLAQEISSSLSPSEAYKAALSPLNAARAQQDNLTDADKFALGVGMARASREIPLPVEIRAFEHNAIRPLTMRRYASLAESISVFYEDIPRKQRCKLFYRLGHISMGYGTILQAKKCITYSD